MTTPLLQQLLEVKFAFGSGNGGYGRLGHSVQQDEFKPRKIETLTGRMPVQEGSIVRPSPTARL